MSVCTFSKEYFRGSSTLVDNGFMTFLREAPGDAVKVYLIGLSVCQNGLDFSLNDISRATLLTDEQVIDFFKFWQDFDLVRIISTEPFEVQYLPIDHTISKPKKYNPEKYAAFSNAVQGIITSRMISTAEFSSYYDIMELYGMQSEALYLVIKYCADMKGSDISYRYIEKVAKDFAKRNLTTEKLVQREVSSFYDRNDDLHKLLIALGSKKSPDPDDAIKLKHWITDFGFDVSAVFAAAAKLKKKSMAALDSLMSELYSAKSFSTAEIEDFIKHKDELYTLTLNVAKELGIYIEIIQPYAETYTAKWLGYGFDFDCTNAIAKYCFVHGIHSFEGMDKKVTELADKGIVSSAALAEYIDSLKADDAFLGKLLETAGTMRRVNEWDRNNLREWKKDFTYEMILEAAKIAGSSSNPMAYIKSVLADWKKRNIFKPEDITDYYKRNSVKNTENTAIHFENTRKYTKEELDALIDDVKDIEL